MDVKEVREAILYTIATLSSNNRVPILWNKEWDGVHKGRADSAIRQLQQSLSALSAIDHEAIRAEARTEYRVELDAYIRTLRNFRDNWDCDEDAHAHGTTCRACEAADVLGHFARDAIIADEPKERDSREGLLYKSDVDDRG